MAANLTKAISGSDERIAVPFAKIHAQPIDLVSLRAGPRRVFLALVRHRCRSQLVLVFHLPSGLGGSSASRVSSAGVCVLLASRPLFVAGEPMSE